MPRTIRIEKRGFHHISNQCIEGCTVFAEKEDFYLFLSILEESAETYNFTIYSFCLMPNQYHLLLETFEDNISLIMRQINSKYSLYFNKKYKREGALWKGRFKSHYIYEKSYLSSIVKYIEGTPVKAGITRAMGEYRWAMSSKHVFSTYMDYRFIDSIDLKKVLDENERKKVQEVFSVKFETKKEEINKQPQKQLKDFFQKYKRDIAIAMAIKEGYMQTQIAKYLKLSTVSISKIYKIYRKKIKLFDNLKRRGVFWSYSKDMCYEQAGENLTIEYLLKYGDFYELCEGMELFGKRRVKKIWEERLVYDRQFVKINLMIARVFFHMNVESSYFKEKKNERLEKLRLLAS